MIDWPSSLIHFQHRQKSFLRNLYATDFLHALLAFLLFLEQLAFARDVAAIALRDHVLAHRLHCLARNYFSADGRLDWYFKKLARDQVFHLCRQGPALRCRRVAMKNQRQRIDGFTGNEHVELDEIAFPIARQMIVERSVSARS